MITAENMKPGMTAYWFGTVLLIAILGVYGRPVIVWMLMKLYEFFIQNTPMKLG